MTPVGPATEAGAPVVPSAPKNAEERLEYLVKLAVQAFNTWDGGARLWGPIIRERMAQAAQAWELEVADAREEALETIADLEIERDRLRAQVAEAREDRQGHEALSLAHDRIAQLEETVASLAADLRSAEALHAQEKTAAVEDACEADREYYASCAELAGETIKNLEAELAEANERIASLAADLEEERATVRRRSRELGRLRDAVYALAVMMAEGFRD